MKRYIVFYDLWSNLTCLVELLERQRKGEQIKWIDFASLVSPRTTIIEDEQGNLHNTGLGSVVETLTNERKHRLRFCEVCQKIFWANYKNSFTCSTPCLNALRQRRHRKTNKEAINEKRRDNYRRNKKLKQLKEKKNGTL